MKTKSGWFWAGAIVPAALGASFCVRASCFRCLFIAPLGIETRIAWIHRFFSFYDDSKFSIGQPEARARLLSNPADTSKVLSYGRQIEISKIEFRSG